MVIFLSKNNKITNLMDEEHSMSMRKSKTINLKKFVHKTTLMVLMLENGKLINLMDEEHSNTLIYQLTFAILKKESEKEKEQA